MPSGGDDGFFDDVATGLSAWDIAQPAIDFILHEDGYRIGNVVGCRCSHRGDSQRKCVGPLSGPTIGCAHHESLLAGHALDVAAEVGGHRDVAFAAMGTPAVETAV